MTPPNAEAKVRLLEFILACEDLDELTSRTLAWLGEQTGARQAACLILESESQQMVGAAGYGLPDEQVRAFALDLTDRAHPLVRASAGALPVTFDRASRDRRLASGPFGGSAFVAIPLHGRLGKRECSAGLLLVAPPTPEIQTESVWLAPMLGHRLVRLSRADARDVVGRLQREQVLLDAVPDPILLTDPEGRLLMANARARGLLANTEGESEGRRQAIALNNTLFSAALAQGAIRDGTRTRELLLVDPLDGSDLLMELMSTVISDPREGTGVVSILRNVSDLRRAMQEIEENYRRLREAEADVRAERDRLNLIIDSVADPILVTDSAGALVLMNQPAERLFSVPPQASPDQALRARANDARFSSFVSNVLLSRGVSHRAEINLVDPATAAPVPVEAVAGKVMLEHGEVGTVVTVLHDRTEQIEKARLYEELKQASAQLEHRVQEATAELISQNELLRRQRLELEQASALKSQFLANMSHEFRTPLNAILGYTSLLLQGVSGPLTPQQQKNLGRLDSSARHLLSLINDILDISRIEAGRMPLNVGEVDLPALMAEVVAELDPLITRSKLAVRCEPGGNVPRVQSDRAKVKQILVNLVSNAVKFTASGSVTIGCRRLAGSRDVVLSVADTGIGIAAADLEKIFEDFRQADSSAARPYGGAGLGLAISRRLAHMLAGHIEVKSRPGQGSTFSLALPRQLPP